MRKERVAAILRARSRIVPAGTPGLRVAPKYSKVGWSASDTRELSFDDVRVPAENLISGEGEGFAIAQARLGPGRIHHCMRQIGACERALKLMCERVTGRVAFGKPLAKFQVWRHRLVEHLTAIEAARCLLMPFLRKPSYCLSFLTLEP